MSGPLPVTRVAAGVIGQGGRYLIAKRKADAHLGGLWEFPGGKCDSGEDPVDCLKRELWEELAVRISLPIPLCVVNHDYPERRVELHFFRCRIEAGEARPLGCSELRWVTPGELSDFAFPPADAELIERLQAEPSQLP
ncbi:MAG: (deoxy)nucleoside triphosphate pyrophosphohydrolase [Nitrospiraceae bacterium]